MVVMVETGAVRQNADITIKLDQFETTLSPALLKDRHRPGGTALAANSGCR